MPSGIPIFPARLDWSSAIGLFIINYGMLDWHLLAFLEERISPDEFAKIKNWHFKDRIEEVKSAVATGQYAAEQRRSFERFFVRLEPIRELRNHIAHGHLLIHQVPDDKTLVLTLSLPKNLDAVDAPESRHLEFQELTKALSELTALIEDFKGLSGFRDDS